MKSKYINLLRNICFSKAGRLSPFTGVFWITEKCNNKCKICNIWKSEHNNEMNLSFFKKIFETSKLLPRLSLILFTGGEPFLKDDLSEFVDVVNKYAAPLNISFATNGSLTDKTISTLNKILARKGSPINVKLSVDGVGETHDKIRGVEGTFKKSMQTLSQMCDLKEKYPRRFSISIGFTATSLNYHQMPQVMEIAKKNRVDFFYKPIMHAEWLQNAEINKNLFLSREQKAYLVAQHRNIIANLKNSRFSKRYLYNQYLGYLDKYYSQPLRYIPCYALRASFHISADWKVFSCLKLAYVIGDLRANTFEEIFYGNEAFKVKRKIEKNRCHCLCTADIFPSILMHNFPFLL